MNLTMLAAPAAVRLGVAAAEGTTRRVTDFADHLAEAFRGDGTSQIAATADTIGRADESAAGAPDSENLRSLKAFLNSIGVDWQRSIEWDGQEDRIAEIHADRIEPWQATSLRKWLDERPHLKPTSGRSGD